jgi:plastocyanin
MAVRRRWVAWVAALIAACGLLALPLVAFAATSPVTIQGSAFSPATITVRAGDAVTWTNRDGFSHTATSDSAAWDTGIINTGASKTITFASAGTFAYHCSIHTFMKGSIIVQAVATPAPTAIPTPVPTPVRTDPPTVAPTAQPTAAPTATPSESPTTPSPSASSPTAPPPSDTPTPSASAVAVQVSSAPTAGSNPGNGPLVIGVAALAVVALGAIAFFLLRRS